MIAVAEPRRWRARLIWFLRLVGIVAVLHLISHVTGFGDWLNGTSSTVAVVRLITVLFFGACALVMLLVYDEDEEPRRLRDWFYAAFAFAIAIANGALLVRGE